MTEYIEREATVKAFCEQCSDYVNGKCTYEGACEVSIIATVPTADVQPVRHMRWITNFVTGMKFACSNCFEQFDVNVEGVEKWNGCPICLAKMKGDK